MKQIEFTICKRAASELDEDALNWEQDAVSVLEQDYGILPIGRYCYQSKSDSSYVRALYYKCAPFTFRRLLQRENLKIDHVALGICFLKSEG